MTCAILYPNTDFHLQLELTALSHHQVVSTFILNGQENLWYDNEDPAFGRWVDGPSAFNVCWIVPRVVGWLNVAGEISQLPSTLSVCERSQICLGTTRGEIIWTWTRGPTVHTHTYFYTAWCWWSRRSQWLCFRDMTHSSFDRTPTDRFLSDSGCSDVYWCCSNVLVSTELQEPSTVTIIIIIKQ